MKNHLLLAVVLTSLIVSCTTENFDTITVLESGITKAKLEHIAKSTSKSTQTLSPENPDNIYDFVGKIHNDILDAYLSRNYTFNTIAEISQKVDSISALNEDFLNTGSNLPINFQEIQEVITDPQIKFNQVVANSSMTNAAKICLSNFMNSILVWETNDYSEIHQSIVVFEESVMLNTAFNIDDRRIILTTSSIARYSLYYSKERKDKDWETSVGNRVGAVIGAVTNSGTAVKKSIVTGLLIQNGHKD